MAGLRTPLAKGHRQNQRGSTVAEFVLVAPFILALAGYGLRFSQELQAQQLALNFSRELATNLSSKCVDITIQQVPAACTPRTALCVDTVKTQNAIASCIATVAAPYQRAWATMAPSSASSLTVSAEVYRYNLGSFQIDTVPNCTSTSTPVTLLRRKITSSGDSSVISSAQADDISNETCNTDVPYATVCKRNRVSRAVLEFSMKPLTSLIPGSSSANNSTIRYETTL
jgi:hypothetical protein